MKLGIIGSGVIVQVALESIQQIENTECTALWCREVDIKGARELQKKFNIEHIYTDLDEFLKDNSFDTVYVGVINSLHYINTKKALLANKNVICEKPFTPTGAQAEELFKIAKEKKLFLFEAIMLRYLDNYEMIRSKIHELGDIKMVLCNYSQYSRRYDMYVQGTVLPAFDPKLAGGCIYDINIYCIHFVMGLFGKPETYKYYPSIGFNGIDVNGVLILDYGDFKAVCCGAKDSNSKAFCSIQGTKGYIHVDSLPGQVENISLVMNKKEALEIGNTVESPMINEFIKIDEIMANQDYDTCYRYMEQTVLVMETVEKARSEAGIHFEDD